MSRQAAFFRFLGRGISRSWPPVAAATILGSAAFIFSWRSCAEVSVRPHWKHLTVRVYQSRSSKRSPPHFGQALSQIIYQFLTASIAVTKFMIARNSCISKRVGVLPVV